MNQHWISWMVAFPMVGVLAQAFMPGKTERGSANWSRWAALASSLASSICAILLLLSLHFQTPEMQAREFVPWIESYAIGYEMGIDGLNALLVLLIAVSFPLLIAAEWDEKTGVRGVHGLLLVLQTAFLGTACSQDLFLLFFFWALSALPFYFLIGIWGESKREAAAFRSIVSASVGNSLFFAALVLVYFAVSPHSFSIKELMAGGLESKTFSFLGTELSVTWVAFSLMSLGLILRMPIWPLHQWFKGVAEEAPPSVFVALAGVGVPMATYIFTRVSYTLFPHTIQEAAHVVVVIGTINLVIGGVSAAAQRNLRTLLAFVCLSEVGLILMGIGSLNSAGVVGSVYQQFALGVAVVGFGLFSGVVVKRTGKANFLDQEGETQLGGIASQAPVMAVVAGIIVASLLGFPGMGGFVGHSLLMIGSYTIYPAAVLVTGLVVLLTTYYLFTMYRQVFLGKVSSSSEGFADLTVRERGYLFPVVVTLLVFGVYPRPLIELVRPTVNTLLQVIK